MILSCFFFFLIFILSHIGNYILRNNKDGYKILGFLFKGRRWLKRDLVGGSRAGPHHNEAGQGKRQTRGGGPRHNQFPPHC